MNILVFHSPMSPHWSSTSRVESGSSPKIVCIRIVLNHKEMVIDPSEECGHVLDLGSNVSMEGHNLHPPKHGWVSWLNSVKATYGNTTNSFYTAKLYLQYVFLDTNEMMLQHPIYQQLLEGGCDPLVLSASTERILLHPIYQLLLEGGYNPLVLSATTERMLRHPI